MTYTHYFDSYFPESIIPLSNFKDVDAKVLSLVNQIKKYQLAGDYGKSKEILDENKDLLADYMITAEYINMLDEETRNIEIYAKGTSQSTYYQTTVPTVTSGIFDVWIGN